MDTIQEMAAEAYQQEQVERRARATAFSIKCSDTFKRQFQYSGEVTPIRDTLSRCELHVDGMIFTVKPDDIGELHFYVTRPCETCSAPVHRSVLTLADIGQVLAGEPPICADCADRSERLADLARIGGPDWGQA